MKRRILIGVALMAVVVGAVTFIYFRTPPTPRPPVLGELVSLSNDLTPDERQEFYHLAEGSELYPVSWMQALKTQNGKYFLDEAQEIGFLPDSENLDGLPVGLTSGVTRGLEPLGPMSGLNCTACHVGEIHYNEKRVRIDGAPNLLNTRAFYVLLIESALATAKDPNKLIAFTAKVHEIEEKKEKQKPSKLRLLGRKVAVGLANRQEAVLHTALKPALDELIENEFASPRFSFKAALKDNIKDLGKFNEKVAKDLNLAKFREHVKHSIVLEGVADEDEKHGAFQDLIQDFYIKLRTLRARAEFLKRLGMVGEDTATELWGPGRVDAFGSARKFLFQDTHRPLTPVSYPPIFELPSHDWFHYDNNTNTFLERNFGQALGVGAVWDDESKTYSLEPKNLRRLESLARKLTAPKWPEDIFGKIDRGMRKRGEALYGIYCAECHDPAKNVKFDKLEELAVINTDGSRAQTFAAAVPPTNEKFPDMIQKTLAEIKMVALAEFSPEEQEIIKKDPVIWQGPGKYSARTTKGSWATAPYLHNGSVPTLYELLLPSKERPPSKEGTPSKDQVRRKTFFIGSRQFDTKDVGYISDAKTTLFDTSKPGNSNEGHEGEKYGTNLSEEQRRDLLEFLKAN